MSRIDAYKHDLLGFITCNSHYNFVFGNSTRKMAIYKLKEDIPKDKDNFYGKLGDILIGGGSGEAPAFRISYPEAFKFFTTEDFDDFNNYDELFKAFWTPTESYMLCNGFKNSGWKPEVEPIEFWLTERIISILIKFRPEYSKFKKIEIQDDLNFTTDYHE
jgi:hypothetical protein